MADGENVNQLVVERSTNSSKTETTQLEMALSNVRDSEIKMCAEFDNLKGGHITETFFRSKSEKLTRMDHSEVIKLLFKVNEILETNRQKIYINKIIQKENLPNKKIFAELKEATINELLEINTFLKKLIDLKNHKALLMEAILSKDQENSCVTIYNMFMELWSDSE